MSSIANRIELHRTHPSLKLCPLRGCEFGYANHGHLPIIVLGLTLRAKPLGKATSLNRAIIEMRSERDRRSITAPRSSATFPGFPRLGRDFGFLWASVTTRFRSERLLRLNYVDGFQYRFTATPG